MQTREENDRLSALNQIQPATEELNFVRRQLAKLTRGDERRTFYCRRENKLIKEIARLRDRANGIHRF